MAFINEGLNRAGVTGEFSAAKPNATVYQHPVKLNVPNKQVVTMADVRKLTDELSVAPQLTPDDVAEISQQFKSILCNRPDREGGPDQPLYADIERLAEASGMTVVYQPVSSSEITDDDVDDFDDHVEELPKPVLAYCRSGTRCSVLWALSQAGRQTADEILQTTNNAGYALDGLRPRIIDRE